MSGFLQSFGYQSWGLSFVIWFPLVGMVAVLLGSEAGAKRLAFWIALLEFVVSIGLWLSFDSASANFQLGAVLSWIPQWGISYRIGVDGISLFLVLLTTLMTPIAILGSFRYITRREKAFYAMMLLLETGVVGVFCSLDLFLFFTFWEVMLVPMYFIIGIWGGERRVYAAIKFFLYTAFGSLLMLVAILYLFFKFKSQTGAPSFAYQDLLQLSLTAKEQLWLFAAFSLAFLVKVPVFPFHTWLPDAHVEAPTPGLRRAGGGAAEDGRVRLPALPAAAVPGRCNEQDRRRRADGARADRHHLRGMGRGRAARREEADRLHVGRAHGLRRARHLRAHRAGHPGRDDRDALARRVDGRDVPAARDAVRAAPHPADYRFRWPGRHHAAFCAVFVFTALTSIGLPGTSGFVGEFLALLGTFQTHPWIAMFASTGVIFAAYYMLPMVQRIWFNNLDNPANQKLPDLGRREMIVLAPLVIMMLWLGVYPKPVLDTMQVTIAELIGQVEQKQLTPAEAKAAVATSSVSQDAVVVYNSPQLHKR